MWLAASCKNLLHMCVLQQVAGVTEHGQRVHRVSVTAAETLPTLGLVDGDDLRAKANIKASQHPRSKSMARRLRWNTALKPGSHFLFYWAHLPATGCRVAEEVVDHVQFIFLHNNEALLSSLLPVHIRRPLDEERVQMVDPGTETRTQSIGLLKNLT